HDRGARRRCMVARKARAPDRDPGGSSRSGHGVWTDLLWYAWTGKPEDAARNTSRRLGVQTKVVVAPPELCELYLRNAAETPGTCGALLRREAIDDVGRLR